VRRAEHAACKSTLAGGASGTTAMLEGTLVTRLTTGRIFFTLSEEIQPHETEATGREEKPSHKRRDRPIEARSQEPNARSQHDIRNV